MNTQIIDTGHNASGGYKVGVSRSANVDRVSSEWFSRPDDERYLSLDDLFASVKTRDEQSRKRTVESAAIRVEAHRDDPEKHRLLLPGANEPIAPTHWNFGQLSSIVGAPSAGTACRHQPAISADQPWGRADQDHARVFRNVLIVDRLFAAAELRLGGDDQQVIRIVRTDGRPRP